MSHLRSIYLRAEVNGIGGGEGSRTPVLKSYLISVYVHSRNFRLSANSAKRPAEFRLSDYYPLSLSESELGFPT